MFNHIVRVLIKINSFTLKIRDNIFLDLTIIPASYINIIQLRRVIIIVINI